jgi:UDP-glucuronate 4-epimerase
VTGAAGFIGSHVCERLLSQGFAVVGLDNFDPFYDPSIKRGNLACIDAAERGSTPRRFEFVETDVADAGAMHSLFTRIRPVGVIHLAGRAGVRPSIADPVGYSRANVTATTVLLDAAKHAGCERFVLASSSSVYGNSPDAPFREEQPVTTPVSPYAATKAACELIAHTHWHLTRMPTACLRFFTVYGPRQRPDLAIQTFMLKIARGQPLELFGEGTSRDYTYIDDIVDGVLESYRRIDRFGYRVWNLGGNHPVGLDEMVRGIMDVVGREVPITRKPMQPGDVVRTWADLTRSAADLDYSPKVGFSEGLRRQYNWIAASGLV